MKGISHKVLVVVENISLDTGRFLHNQAHVFVPLLSVKENFYLSCIDTILTAIARDKREPCLAVALPQQKQKRAAEPEGGRERPRGVIPDGLSLSPCL